MAAYAIAHFDQIDDQQVLGRYRALAHSAWNRSADAISSWATARRSRSKDSGARDSSSSSNLPTSPRANAWYHSEAYAPALALRAAAGPRSLTIVDGVPAA